MDIRSMAFSDQIIFGALERLIQEKGEGNVITQQMIAEHSGVSLRTTQRALARLTRRGVVIGERTIPVGYRYRIPDGSTRRND